ncbi:MAG: tetratricopeptide repeat protein [Chloroflexota bacterium]
MAKVSLRIYNREIERLTDGGQIDEAIAHCRHILKSFPKHLETYRLLGKAYLEAKRHAEAADIFQRVLVSAPDDFVSHVGMSIIHDEQRHLDEAIWHMERAFESQPSNAAIQAELQRLYGRRDGVEPAKIRLTRGALAHMYLQGDLFAQAIAEIRSVLDEDPSRTDMQVLLALAYFRAGQKVEATEACSNLLGKFPYCLDANRILVEILPSTGMAENTQVYRHRVNELDPYSTGVSGSIFHSEDVPDSAVTLEHLEYKGEAPPAEGDWRGSLTTGFEAAAARSAQPDWLRSAADESAPAAFDSFAAAPEPAAPAAPAEEIPDFLRQAGWGESTGAFDESAAPSAEEEAPAEGLAKADLPDWIKSMAPAEPAAPPAAETEGADDGVAWLESLTAAAAAATAAETPAPETPVAEESTDWLKSLAAEDAFGAPSAPAESPAEPAPGGAPVSGIGSLGTSEAEQDAALRWLESLAEKQGVASEELITDPNARLEKPPEWVEQAKEISESGAGQEMPAIFAEPEAAAEMAAGKPAEPLWPVDDSSVVTPADATGVWLRELAEKDEEAQAAPPPAEEIPLWSGEIEAAPKMEAEPAGESAVPSEDLPEWLRGLEKKEAEAAAPAGEELPEWLKSERPVTGPLITEPTQPTDWMPEPAEAALPPQPRTPEPVAAQPKVETPPAAKPRPKSKRMVTMPLVEPALAQARDLILRGEIPDALKMYGGLIRKGKMLEEVTFDLKEALYRFPVEVSIWQALGDAYMRANRLQDALDAYTKAEELLR